MVLMLWMLVFFAGSVKASVTPVKLAKSAKTVLAAKTSQPDQSTNPSEPLPLPEDPENSIAELEDGADDDKKSRVCYLFFTAGCATANDSNTGCTIFPL